VNPILVSIGESPVNKIYKAATTGGTIKIKMEFNRIEKMIRISAKA